MNVMDLVRDWVAAINAGDTLTLTLLILLLVGFVVVPVIIAVLIGLIYNKIRA